MPAVEVPTSGQTDEAERIRELRMEFSDLRVTIPNMVAEGETVAIRIGGGQGSLKRSTGTCGLRMAGMTSLPRR